MKTERDAAIERATRERAVKFLDYRLTGAEGVIAIDTMSDFMLAETKSLREENERLRAALTRLRDCDWVITPLNRMDAVRDIAREALKDK